MKARDRFLIFAALATGVGTVLAINVAAFARGNDGPLSPVFHAVVPIVTTVGWIAGGIFALCVLISAASLVLGFRRRRW